MSRANLIRIVTAIAIIMAVAFYFYKEDTCQQADEAEIADVMLNCVIFLNPEDVRNKTCEKLQRSEPCILAGSDDEKAIDDVIRSMIVSCMKKELLTQGKCTTGAQEAVDKL